LQATGFQRRFIYCIDRFFTGVLTSLPQTRCSIWHHAAYRYEDNFTRPEEFIPERWLLDASAEFKNDKREVVQPFMVGPRGCLGKGSVPRTTQKLVRA
jgi:hypothetical protein